MSGRPCGAAVGADDRVRIHGRSHDRRCRESGDCTLGPLRARVGADKPGCVHLPRDEPYRSIFPATRKRDRGGHPDHRGRRESAGGPVRGRFRRARHVRSADQVRAALESRRGRSCDAPGAPGGRAAGVQPDTWEHRWFVSTAVSSPSCVQARPPRITGRKRIDGAHARRGQRHDRPVVGGAEDPPTVGRDGDRPPR